MEKMLCLLFWGFHIKSIWERVVGAASLVRCSKTGNHFRNKPTECFFVHQLRYLLCFLISTEILLYMKLRM